MNLCLTFLRCPHGYQVLTSAKAEDTRDLSKVQREGEREKTSFRRHTRLASSLKGRHSPNALTNVVMFFLGSGLANARIIGLRGLVKNRIICQNVSENFWSTSDRK